jgi:23S rRNA (guanosine2251-2'-O)-methyltransferase
VGLVDELIIGAHSIAAALLNPRREFKELLASEEGWADFLKRSRVDTRQLRMKPKFMAAHAVQERAKEICHDHKWEFQRVPGSVFLLAEPLETHQPNWLRENLPQRDRCRILALDQVSDVHNGAAILRTASFFGVDVVILPQEHTFGFTPSFFRIASGASEFLTIVRTAHLARTLTLLRDEGVEVWGLSEHAPNPLTDQDLAQPKICLVLGAEDDGLSHSVMRVASKALALTSQGNIKSLNVSTAATLAMQLCFPPR